MVRWVDINTHKMAIVVLYRWSRPFPRMSLALRASHHMRPATGYKRRHEKERQNGKEENRPVRPVRMMLRMSIMTMYIVWNRVELLNK
jgi:hypothetical protein